MDGDPDKFKGFFIHTSRKFLSSVLPLYLKSVLEGTQAEFHLLDCYPAPRKTTGLEAEEHIRSKRLSPNPPLVQPSLPCLVPSNSQGGRSW